MKRLAAALFIALVCDLSLAQAFPTKAVRIVVAYPPGGGTDVLSRLVGQRLGDSLGQPIVIENRPGGNGKIGMDAVGTQPADGHTLLAIAAGPLNEQNLRLFTPVSLFAAPSYALVVTPSLQAANVSELIALARTKPGGLAYGSTGGGAASHLATELLKSMAGVEILHVPYKGIGNAVSDLLGGQVQMMIAPVPAVISQVRSGKLRALGTTGQRRNPAMPEVPTLSEAGVPGYEASGWFGLVAPAGTPLAAVSKLNTAVNEILATRDVRSRLLELGAEPGQLSPESFLSFIRSDVVKWSRLMKERGIVVEGGS